MRDGHEIPILGYGTYELEGNEAYKGVTWALEDSAAWYDNERQVGQAILDYCSATGTPRQEIFYTTKLKMNNGYDSVKKAIQRSLEACCLGYIDLYLIHGPLGGPNARKESWRAICDFQKESGGLLRSIGISTFGVRHMKDIVESGMPLPAIHQIDLHPFMTRPEIVDYSKKHGITLEAWAPLVRGYKFNHPLIIELSRKYEKEPAQVLLRYSLQKGYIPLPKSGLESRVRSNANVFDYSLTELEVTSLDQLNEDLVTDWDPTDCA
ncbi:hypothetical protein CVT25_000552 [Psilocybe cyanescens]|uniref:NADP-dependent oxidoreductase domain-containing protein n=1 Tax=Psilocybe cyanescens TaxID=93625 RepID=A0A409WZT7_PSICY|nr:hypothetical protein CVT25_000552 [Psilocybe cyanescens]